MSIIHDEVDDRTLVIRHREGDDDAFREIVVRHHQSLLAHACRRLGGDPVAADDVVQETYLRAFRAIDRLDGDYHLAAWLHRILTNVCADAGRRRGRELRLMDKVSGEVEVEAPAADSELAGVPTDTIERALESMPATYREVLLLRFVEELSYSDVALKAGISEDNARARVHRGRLMLRRLLAGAAAVLGWMVPSLRRPQQALAADPAAIDMATTVQHAQPVSQLVTLASQFSPAVASASPAVTSYGPTLGKAAAAIGLAATVAIPTGAAVERKISPPDPAVTEVIAEEELAFGDEQVTDSDTATAPPTTVKPFAATSTPSSTSGTSSSSSSTSSTSTSSTSAPEPTTTTEEDTTTGSEDGIEASPILAIGTEPPPTTSPSEPQPETEPEPEPQYRTGTMSGEGLQVTSAGPRTEISGPLTLATDQGTFTGTIEGKLRIDEADPKDPGAPRNVSGDLFFTVSDGTTHLLRVLGTAVMAEGDGAQRYDLTTTYRLEGAESFGLAPDGDLIGELHTGGTDGALRFDLSGAPAES